MTASTEPLRTSSPSDLSIAVIGPDFERRLSATRDLAECQSGPVREFATYPTTSDDIREMLKRNFDVVMVDLDSDPDAALEVVEGIRADGPATVMVYSEKNDPEMVVRCMRAGAREFLTLPIGRRTVSEALERASGARPAGRPPKESVGQLLVFLGAKGGSGVTTLASNFAVCLARDSGKSTLLIDLNLPLGDVALNLGIEPQYSTVDALRAASRLDASFLSTLLTEHSSGLSVLGAPSDWLPVDVPIGTVDKLLEVARQKFDYVVVDAGSKLQLRETKLFDPAATIYLVTQVGIPELRNTNRVIAQLSEMDHPGLEIVINRFDPARSAFSEEDFSLGLIKPAKWKVPNDYQAVQRMQNTATPLALEKSRIADMIQQMARHLCGQAAPPEKKKKFGFFR